jgi:benzoate membrane transport protein
MRNSTIDDLRQNLPAVGAAVRSVIIFIAVLSVPLSAAESLALSEPQTTSWLLALYGLSGLLTLALTLIYRQPLLLTGNLFVIFFVTRLADQLAYQEIIGAAIIAGAAVLLFGVLGLTDRLADWIPVPIVYGLLAGVMLTFVADIFNQMTDEPILVGSIFITYLLSRRFLGRQVPAIFPALIVGLAVAALVGQFGPPPQAMSLDLPTITLPVFSLSAVLTAAPIFVVLITLQANLPSVRYLQSQDYRPPNAVINTVSGIGTMLGSFLGPTGISLSLPATSLVAGPEAGERQIRHRAIYLTAGAAAVVGLLAGIAVALAGLVPTALLLTLAGLAVVDILGRALKRVAQGPLLLGPLFALVIAVSDITLLSFGSFFWALVIGIGISLLLEQDALREVSRKSEQASHSRKTAERSQKAEVPG